MLSDGKEVILRDGSKVLISRYRVEDFEKLVEMYASLSRETLKWGAPPYDREVLQQWTQDLKNKLILVAHFEKRIIGHCMANISQRPRSKGTAQFVIYVHQDFQNKGLGTVMTSMAVRLARERGLHRIGLRVVAENKKAIRVYEKVGFRIEGIEREAYYGENGKYHDMVVMGLLP